MLVPRRLYTTAGNGAKAKPHGKAAKVSERQRRRQMAEEPGKTG